MPAKRAHRTSRHHTWNSADLLAVFTARDAGELAKACLAMVQRVVACNFVSMLSRSDGDYLLREKDSRCREYAPEFMFRCLSTSNATSRQTPAVGHNPEW